jgi:hypothetical protein
VGIAWYSRRREWKGREMMRMTDTKVRKKVRDQKVNQLLGPWDVEDGRSDLNLNLDPDKLLF